MESKRERRYVRRLANNGAHAPTPYEALPLKRAIEGVLEPSSASALREMARQNPPRACSDTPQKGLTTPVSRPKRPKLNTNGN